MTAAAPLDALLSQLAGLDPMLRADLGRPHGPGWMRLDRIGSDVLASRVDALAGEHGGRRDVAGSYLGARLARAVVAVPAATLATARRVPVSAGCLWVHEHEGGWFDGVAYERGAAWVLRGDAAARHPSAHPVPDGVALRDAFVDDVVAVLGPLLDDLRPLVPYGRAGLWGAVADEMTAAVLHAARIADRDQGSAWDETTALCDALAARVRWLRARPRPVPVTWAGGESICAVRGTCCLYFKTHVGPDADRYCTTCPHRDDTSRAARWRRQVEPQHQVAKALNVR